MTDGVGRGGLNGREAECRDALSPMSVLELCERGNVVDSVNFMSRDEWPGMGTVMLYGAKEAL